MRHHEYNCVRKATNKTKRHEYTKHSEAKPWLKWLVASLSLWKATSDPRQILLGHVTEKVTLGQAFIEVLWFYPVTFIPPMTHNH
jgi:hypothetical protein